MATTNRIETFEDLLRILDENPEWVEALRVRLLTKELLELPARFAEYVKSNDERWNRNDERWNRSDERWNRSDERWNRSDERFDGLEARLDRWERDMGRLRARHARDSVREQADLLARDLGSRKVRSLTIADLLDMSDAADTSGISTDDLRSFRRADLVLEAERLETGETHYIVVEVSYTVNGRDTTRAMRNAEYLTRFTGMQALAVISGVRKDNRIDPEIAEGKVAFYEIEDERLETE